MVIINFLVLEILTILISLRYFNVWVAAFFIFIFTIYIKKQYKSNLFILLILLTFFTSVFSYNYNSISELRQYQNTKNTIECKILSKSIYNSEEKYFSALVKIRRIKGQKLTEKALLYMKNEDYSNFLPGDEIKFRGNIARSESYHNVHVFSYEKYLLDKKINSIIYAEDDVELTARSKISIRRYLHKIKEKIIANYRLNMNNDSANIILSILLGEKGFLDIDFKSATVITGLAHIFAVSGLHVGIIMKTTKTILDRFLCSRKIKIYITIITAWLYGAMIGFPTSICRALVMFTFLYMAKLLHRKYSSINSLSLSMIILLLINPNSLFSSGFILTYVVTYAIITYEYEKTDNIKAKILENFKLYMRIFMFSAPVLIYFFNYISLISVVLNMIILPIFIFLIQISFILTVISFFSTFLIALPMRFVGYILYFMRFLLLEISQLEFHNISLCGVSMGKISLTQIMSYYSCLFLIRRKFYCEKLEIRRFLALTFFLIVFLNIVYIPHIYGENKFQVYDVGQGNFSIMTYKNHNYIFDAGSTDSNIYKYTVEAIITKNAYENIDSIFISHFHSDHYIAVVDILSKYSVSNIYCSHDISDVIKDDTGDEKNNKSKLEELELYFKDINIKSKVLTSGMRMKLSNTDFIDILSPDSKIKWSNENNYSNVYWIRLQGINILITGDIEADIENHIIPSLQNYVSKYGMVDVLLVPHHGSKTSSTREFIETINPKVAVMSYGNNSYGIPSQEVIDRYKEAEANLLSTFEDGQINFFVINGEMYYNTYSGKVSNNWNDMIKVSITLNLMLLFLICVFRRIYELQRFFIKIK